MADETSTRPQHISGAALRQNIGSSGLQRFGGFIVDLDQPPSGLQWTDVYRVMSTAEPVITAVLAAFETLASRVKWTVQPADDSPEAQAMADFVDGCLHDQAEPFVEVLSEVWTMLIYGWALLETTYKLRNGDNEDPAQSSKYTDGKVGWARQSLRGQETRYRWDFDENGNVLGMWQIAPPSYQTVYIPAEKFLLFRTTTRRGNPEGHSLLRAAYGAYAAKTNIERIEGIGIERDLAGIPIVYVPPELLRSDATPEEQGLLASMFTMVTNIKRDTNEGLVFPLQYDANGHLEYDIKLLSATGHRQFDTDKTITRHEQRITMAMLADFMFIGHDTKGSFSLIQDKTKLFRDSLDTYLNRICGVWNTYAIPRLVRLNGHDTNLSPELTHSDVAEIDLQQLAAWLTALGPAQANLIDTTDPELRRHVLEIADLPSSGQGKAVDDQAGDQAEATPEDLEVPS